MRLLGSAILFVLCACGDRSPSAGTVLDGAVIAPAPGEAGTAGDASVDVATDAEIPFGGDEYGVRDRAGRPLVVRLLASPGNLDLYNSSLPPAPIEATARGQGAPQSAGRDFQGELARLDLLDGADDWKGGPPNADPEPGSGKFPHPLANAWLADVIVVDTAKPFSTSGYLEIEAKPGANATCGGRWFEDDAVDKTLSFLVKGRTTGVSDGVDAATKAPSLTFPYLAAPN